MAAFLKSQITSRIDRVTKDPPHLRVSLITASISAQGGDGANKIGAAALGFDKILSVGNMYDSAGGKGYVTMTDGTNVFVMDDLTDGDIADVTITSAVFTVIGTPAA